MTGKVSVLALLIAGLAFGGWLPLNSSGPTAPQIQLIKEGPSATVIDVTIPGLQTTTENVAGVTYTKLALPNEPGMTADVGLPQLPRIIKLLGIPDNASVSVEVLTAQFRTFPNILVYPAQKPLTDLDEFEFTIDRGFYAQDKEYPEELFSIGQQATWRGLPYVTIGLNPVHYNPARQELVVYSHLVVRVNHPGQNIRHQVEPWLAKVYQANIDNFSQLDLDIGWNDGPGVRYLVIAHSNYLGGWLDSLVNWHQKRGIETRVIAKSSWTDTEVKDSVLAEYNRNNPKTLRWVLLVGEYNEVPGHAYPGVGYSDVWYVDLEPPAGDDYFDVGIGRFSPSSVADLGN